MKKTMSMSKICTYMLIIIMMIIPIKIIASGSTGSIKLSMITDTTTVRVGESFYVDIIVDASETAEIDQIISSITWTGDYIKVIDMRMITGTGWTDVNKSGTVNAVMGGSDELAYFKIFHEQYHTSGHVIRISFQAVKAVNNLNISFSDYQMFTGDNEIINETEVRNLTISILPESSSDTGIEYEIDYINHQLLINNENNKRVYLGVVNGNNIVKNVETFLLNTNSTKTKINLSNFSIKKDWTLRIYGDTDSKEIDVLLVKGPKKVKAFYYPDKKTIYDRIKFTADDNEIALNRLEFRTVSSAWIDASTLTIDYLDSCSVFGATLLFRVKAVHNESPYSGEAKVKIPKARSAPKAVINYSKLTIKLPAKSEYRISTTGNWQEASSGLLDINDISDITMKDFYLETRYMADIKKPESKTGIYKTEKQTDGPFIGEEGILQIIYTSNDREQTTDVTLVNLSLKEIEFIFAPSDTSIDTINLTTQTWSKLKADSEVKLNKSESNGKIIIARYPAITTKNINPQFASRLVKSESITWKN